MAFQNKDLQVGDLLESEIGEVWCYLGFFEGTPHSFYNVPDCGHMYLFCDSMSGLSNEFLNHKIVAEAVAFIKANGGELCKPACYLILNKNFDRLRSSFDGNARYTKSYMRVKRRIGHMDIPDRATRFGVVYGCRRLGDKKPRGYKV